MCFFFAEDGEKQAERRSDDANVPLSGMRMVWIVRPVRGRGGRAGGRGDSTHRTPASSCQHIGSVWRYWQLMPCGASLRHGAGRQKYCPQFRARGRHWWPVRRYGGPARQGVGAAGRTGKKHAAQCRQRGQACMLCCSLRRRQATWRVPVCLPTKNGLSPRGNSPFFVHVVRHSSVAAVPGKAT